MIELIKIKLAEIEAELKPIIQACNVYKEQFSNGDFSSRDDFYMANVKFTELRHKEDVLLELLKEAEYAKS
jgi:hypothetical protein